MQEFWRPVIQQNSRVALADRVASNKSTFYVIPRPYILGTVRGTLYLCLTPASKSILRDWRREEIVQAQKRLREGKTNKAGLEKYFDTRGRPKASVLKQAEEFDGYSCIFSTHPLDKADFVRGYFDKHLVEKAFHSLEGAVKFQPVRHRLAHRVIAHVFICYLAYLLLSLLKFLL